MRLLHFSTLLALLFGALVMAQSNPYYVTSPTAGQVLQPGQTVQIVWLNGMNSPVTINVLTGTDTTNLQSTGISIPLDDGSVGSYSWQVPTGLSASGPFSLQFMYQTSSGTQFNYSPQFYIAAQAPTTTTAAPTTTTTAPTSSTTSASSSASSKKPSPSSSDSEDGEGAASMLKSTLVMLAVPAFLVAGLVA